MSIKTTPVKPTRINTKKLYSYKLFLMVFPFLVLVFLFLLFPLHGWAYAFYDYRPPFQLKDCEFVGLKWFTTLFSNASKRKQIRCNAQHFAMSGLSILFSWLPMAFAILLSEIKCNWFKKVVQTLTTPPHFISWFGLRAGLSLFSSSGMVNNPASGWCL